MSALNNHSSGCYGFLTALAVLTDSVNQVLKGSAQ